ncbi:MORC family CW-type zinc finger protein 3-like [Trifolium pratense]|uniref:MORC family CW-type zinc finger protein 3-like n=1 Tax=Trifolium pratense TaxID=57577 RepID=A0A2K3PMD4_TRIPR|nr:MORC family CW-type zinc finger protein 3-like [Trifolium pratense]
MKANSPWFCYMEPCKGQCADPEQKQKPGVVTISTKRSGYDHTLKDSPSLKIETGTDASRTDNKLVNSEEVKSVLKRLKRGLPNPKSPSLPKQIKR